MATALRKATRSSEVRMEKTWEVSPSMRLQRWWAAVRRSSSEKTGGGGHN
eukprot:CAMPEP_0185778524 /NCGR_PEP_ID=MMETSP1174-20130828/92751_1 /TAXON_ID=35687 /ORGANISM="Dictyocha speculum, Strain CCMP1381" /LENGTH=49 /DNA_ID= /DNA_START= /DNA_END= /DNA_ORIENTATION=